MEFDNVGNKKLAVAFLGCIFEEGIEDIVLKNEKGFPQIAANNLGWMFADGLKYHFGSRLKIFSVLAVSRYPRFKKLFIKPSAWNPLKETRVTYVNYLNIPFFKHFSILLSAFITILPWVLSNRRDNKVLVVYSMYAPFPVLAKIISVLFGVKVILIVPDLPEFMRVGVKTHWLLNLAVKINHAQLYFFSKRFSGYVFLTKFMAEKLNVGADKYVVIEGCVNISSGISPSSKFTREPNTRSLLYAGNLNKAYGVKMLIDGFMKTNDTSYRLWLCGAGPMKEEIENACKEDSRIKYFGVVTKQEIQELSTIATALINPRTSEGIFTRYSFPSKIFEYLQSGTPTIMCRLPEIPDEYFSYVYVIEDESVGGLSKAVDYVLSLKDAELEGRGIMAKEFVVTNKNNILQVGKLANYIKKLF